MSNQIGALLGREKHRLLNKPGPCFVLPDTDLGVEVEVEGVSSAVLLLHPSPLDGLLQAYWNHEEDQSLHNRGREFVFKQPMFGSDVEIACKGLLDLCKSQQWETSLRTGIHIHMDARDLTPPQLLGLIAIYIIFEPVIYNWVGDNRHANNFCLPWFKSEESFNQAIMIIQALLDRGGDRALGAARGFERYAGLNLKSLQAYGSIEFRHLKTTFEWSRLKDWINIILSLKKYAFEVPESTLAIVDEISRDITGSFHHIFGNIISDTHLTECLNFIQQSTIPSSIEFIGRCTPAELHGESLFWNPGASIAEKKNHPGFIMWRKRNFPKGLSPNPEEKSPPKKPRQPRTRIGNPFRSGEFLERINEINRAYADVATTEQQAPENAAIPEASPHANVPDPPPGYEWRYLPNSDLMDLVPVLSGTPGPVVATNPTTSGFSIPVPQVDYMQHFTVIDDPDTSQ